MPVAHPDDQLRILLIYPQTFDANLGTVEGTGKHIIKRTSGERHATSDQKLRRKLV